MGQKTKDAPQQIRNFLQENFLFSQECILKDSDSFLDSGILDSTGILQLIAFLTETYGIQVEDEEISPDNLDSVDKVLAYLHRKSSAATHVGNGQMYETR